MFGIFKKKEKSSGVAIPLPVTTDIHSHILPGIDDGSPNIETSLKLVKGLYDIGIRKTVATPHVIGDMYRNTPEIINEALEKLNTACRENNIQVEISAAAEYMLDDYFLKLLHNNETLLPIHGKIILTEQSYATPTTNLNEISFDLVSRGYKPIMAHPERYFFYHNDYDEYGHLKDMGFLLQVNLLSLTGYYGKAVVKAAKYILENDLADLVGTDMHHERHLRALQDKNNLEIFQKYLGNKQYNLLESL
ncbi:MAG: histidinol phosphatase [Ferruginibacter sp.]